MKTELFYFSQVRRAIKWYISSLMALLLLSTYSQAQDYKNFKEDRLQINSDGKQAGSTGLVIRYGNQRYETFTDEDEFVVKRNTKRFFEFKNGDFLKLSATGAEQSGIILQSPAGLTMNGNTSVVTGNASNLTLMRDTDHDGIVNEANDNKYAFKITARPFRALSNGQDALAPGSLTVFTSGLGQSADIALMPNKSKQPLFIAKSTGEVSIGEFFEGGASLSVNGSITSFGVATNFLSTNILQADSAFTGSLTSSEVLADNIDADEVIASRLIVRGDQGSGTANMTVYGGINAVDLHLDPDLEWPDYVFEKDYALAPLSEVDAFIAENGHLPNVPSAEEVKASGYSQAEMNGIL
ncbi:MAG: hypothetical protein AAF551_03430, partial [Bacteroidota bacterium]